MNSYSPIEWVSLDTVLRLPVHPVADNYRLLKVEDENDTSLSSIADGMRDNGFDELRPLVLFKGLLLDGRNRRAAAHIAGLQQVPVVEFYGTEQEARIKISQANDNRRHDRASQRAWAVVNQWDELAAQAKERSKRNLKQGREIPECPTSDTRENGAFPSENGDSPSVRRRTLGEEGPTSVGAVNKLLAKRANTAPSTMSAARALRLRQNAMKETVAEAEYEIGELEDEVTRLLKEVVYAEMDGRLQDRNELETKKKEREQQLGQLRTSIATDRRNIFYIEDEIAKGTSVVTLNNKFSDQPKNSRIPDKKKTVAAYDNLRRGFRVIERSLKYLATCSGPDCFKDDAREILDLLVGLGQDTIQYEPPKRFELGPRPVSTSVSDVGNTGGEPKNDETPECPTSDTRGNGSQNGDSPSVRRRTLGEGGPQNGGSPVFPTSETLGGQPINDETAFVGDDDWMFERTLDEDARVALDALFKMELNDRED